MRTVTIMSGVSGSGKSTEAARRIETYKQTLGENVSYPMLFKQDNDAHIVCLSTDHYFMSEEGVYEFNPNHLGIAHGNCLRNFIMSCQDEVEQIVVDNTNCTNEELAPYIAIARAFDYRVEVVTIMCSDLTQLENCFYRNGHGVPYPGVKRMHENLQRRYDNFPAHWKFDPMVKFTIQNVEV